MKAIFTLLAITLGSNWAIAKGTSRGPASKEWTCCAGTSSKCSQGVEVTCEKTSGDTTCSADDGESGAATVEKSSPTARTVTFQDGKVYTACGHVNND